MGSEIRINGESIDLERGPVRAKYDPDPLWEVMTYTDLKLRYQMWMKEDEVHSQRVDRKEQGLRNIKNEIYQLLGFDFVFQGVVLTAVSQTNQKKCGFSWIPMVLSLFASCATFFGIYSKLNEKKLLEKDIREEKCQQQAILRVVDNLKVQGRNFDLKERPVVLPNELKMEMKKKKKKITIFNRKIDQRSLILGLLYGALFVFSGLVCAYCNLIVCW